MISLLAVTSLVVSYACDVEPPRAPKEVGDKFAWKELGLPPESQQWHFTVMIAGEKPPIAEVKWRADPIQTQGRFPVISTGKNAYSFVSLGAGPCLMTETACLALFSIADQNRDTAEILIEPTALWTNAKRSLPFVAKLEGHCARTESKK